jgi:hypothetical protein
VFSLYSILSLLRASLVVVHDKIFHPILQKLLQNTTIFLFNFAMNRLQNAKMIQIRTIDHKLLKFLLTFTNKSGRRQL